MRIGRYEIVRRLGTGGMGEVFLALSSGAEGFEKEVVIKRILPHLADQPQFVRRFIEEGKLAVRLHHAGIAQVLDLAEDASGLYMAMEYVEGADLRSLMRALRGAEKRLPVELSCLVLSRILEALDYAHSLKGDGGQDLGIIHRDVSPSNIMVSVAGDVKLLDFGIARAADRLQISLSGVLQGKASYMSPEQAAGDRLNQASDLFSVGIVAYEMLAGERPFDGPTDLKTMDKIRRGDRRPLISHCPELDEGLAAVVERLLAPDVSARFADAEAAREALTQAMSRLGFTAGNRGLADQLLEAQREMPEAFSTGALDVDELLSLGVDHASGLGEDGPKTRTATAASPLAAPSPSPTPTRSSLGPPTVSRSARSGRMMAFLILANVALLTTVGLFLGQELSGDEGTTPVVLDAPLALGTKAAPAEPTPAAPADVGPTPRAAQDEARRPTLSTKTKAVTTPEIPTPPTPAPIALVDVAKVTLDASPSGAFYTSQAHGTGALPKIFELGPHEVARGMVRLAGHRPRAFTIRSSDGPLRKLLLTRLPTGTLKLRFFPAAAHITIDSKRIEATRSNVLEVKLPTGEHTLKLGMASGEEIKRRFVIRAGEEVNLQTLDLTRGSQ